jgi:hypothetical protein
MKNDQPIEITRTGQWPVIKYNVRRPRHSNATVFIDDETGMIVIDTDFGQQDAYSHWWGQQGRGTETLREFLITTNDGYLKDKFSYGRSRFSVSEAEKRMREELDKMKAAGTIDDLDMDMAEEFFGDVRDNATSNEFYLLAMENDVIAEHLGLDFFFENNPGSVGANEDSVNMVDKVLMPLIEFWKEELKVGNRT